MYDERARARGGWAKAASTHYRNPSRSTVWIFKILKSRKIVTV
jgi:hypothetical protein